MGIIDDITPLRAGLKFIVQILAALIPVYYGVQITCISNPNLFSDQPYMELRLAVHPDHSAVDRRR